MRLLILSTNQQRDENIFPVMKRLHEQFGVVCDYVVTNGFHANGKPPFIHELLKVEVMHNGEKRTLDALDNSYKRRFRNLALLRPFLTKDRVDRYDALLVGGDDYLGRYFMKKFRGKQRFLIQDGLFFNITSKLIYKEIIGQQGKKNLPAALFFFKYVAKEVLIRFFSFLDVSYLFFSYSGNSEYDLFFISGHYTKKLLNNQGVADKRLHVSGMPRFQYLFRDKSRKQKGAPFTKAPFAITFMTGAYKNHSQFEMDVCEKNFLKELCSRLQALANEVHLYIKIHPRDALSDYKQYSGYEFVTLVNDIPIKRVLLESDVILANASTTTVEAAFMDTPVIITLVSFVQSFTFSSYYSYNKDYYCVAETWEELDELLLKLLRNPVFKEEVIYRQRRLIESLICSNTQQSDETIATEIYRRLEKAC